MFYRTIIDSVGDGFAIDIHGNYLYFMGYLPVKQGDAVFTDGKFIFGNAPPKGSNILIDELSGIPVLAYSGFVRGYYSLSCKWHDYKITGDNWIVNEKKKYAHDNGYDENIIDAEIASDGELLLALLAQDINSCLISIFKNDTLLEQINVYSLINDFTLETLDAVNINLEDLSPVNEEVSVNPTVLNFKLSTAGDWSLLLGVNISASRSWKYSYTDWNTYSETVGKKKEFYIFPGDYTAGEVIAKAYALVGDIGVDLDLEHKITVPPTAWRWLGIDVSLKQTSTSVTPSTRQSSTHTLSAYCRLLLKISSDGSILKIVEKKWYDPFEMYHIIRSERFTVPYSQIVTAPPPDANKPYETTTVYESDSNNTYWTGRVRLVNVTGFLDNIPISVTTGQEVNFGVPTKDYFYHTVRHYTLDNLPISLDFFDVDRRLNQFSFPIQDGFNANLINVDDNINHWQLQSISDPNNQTISASLFDTSAHRWNMSICPIKNGYLFGIHGGDLFSINQNGDFHFKILDLKNFRLRELKKIRKAKH